MPAEVELVKLEESQIQQAGEMMARSFFDDPLVQYVLPNEEDRRELLPLRMIPLIRYCVLYGSAYTTAGNSTAVAVWLPPDQTHMTEEKIKQAGLDQIVKIIGLEALHCFETVNEYVEAFHLKEGPEPHCIWHSSAWIDNSTARVWAVPCCSSFMNALMKKDSRHGLGQSGYRT